MRKKWLLAVKFLVFVGLAAAFLFGAVMPQYTMGFNASLLDKLARLRSLTGPKIVLVGNSNLPFGVDSRRVEEAFGMPVVNLGLHGGLGNAFHEELARINVSEGDIYVLCHTEYDDPDTIPDPGLLWITLENHMDLWPLVRGRDMGTALEAFPGYVKRALSLWASGKGNRETEDAYKRSAFNAYGDNIYPRPLPSGDVEVDFTDQSVPEVGEACATRINALTEYLAGRGARLVVAGFPIANGEHTPLVSEYEAFQQTLEDALDAPVISYFPAYMMDYGYFCDTIYHLTDDGVRLRTNLLIEDLERYIETLAL